MKKVLLTVFLLIVFPVLASHIVGGEFELLHISGNNYKLNMILYFDKIHGNPGARDTSVTASIYEKGTDRWIRDIKLHLYSETAVGYTQQACSTGSLETSKIFYSTSIVLSPDIYNNAEGYYVSWQRCCRNYSITNIYSDDPNNGGQIPAGQTFYLEFPPVVKDGKPFYNSSPHLFPPLNDYACPLRPYYVNFAGVDDDGDSLAYSLTVPISTTTSDPLPKKSPAPYPLVTYRSGFSLANVIDGQPDLNISSDGFLRCTPTIQGLFVFAVKVEQYRKNVKIGETRRDFQMLVTDGCQPDAAPSIKGKKSGETAFSYTGNMSVVFNPGIPDTARCIKVRISDADSQNPLDNNSEIVDIRVIPINFKSDDVPGFLPAITTATLTNGSTKDFSVCFPRCPPVPSGKFTIGIIAADDACSLPRTDTLFVDVTIIPPPNTPPHFTLPAVLPLSATLNEGENMSWPVKIIDNENDSILIAVQGADFDPANAGMTFTPTTNKKGLIEGLLKWDAFCDIYDFTKQTSFKLFLVANDLDLCNADAPVSAEFDLKVILPGVAELIIDTDLTSDPRETKVLGLTRKIGQSLNFNVTGSQADGDLMTMGLTGKSKKLPTDNLTFAPISGATSITSPFHWDIECLKVDPAKQSVYDFYFTLFDNTNKCHVPKYDTVQVEVTIQVPENTAPTFVMQSANALPLTDGHMKVTLGQTIAVSFSGFDGDVLSPANKMKLSLLDATGNVAPDGYLFASVEGEKNVQSVFTWTPSCAIFTNGIYTNDYVFRFLLTDESCPNPKGDTLTLYLEISDIAQNFGTFSPPNVITPNGDYCNDYFALEGLDEDVEAIANCPGSPDNIDKHINLPLDNCSGEFISIRIYNRWGKEVFKSTDRKFRWYAQNADAGVYFYTVFFGKTQYKGTLSVAP